MVDSNDNSSESGEDMLPSQNPESISRKRTHAGYRRSQGHPEENTACQSCRTRKIKCSRQLPCAQCDRLETTCVYPERHKPGVRRGAVESLNLRLGKLENMFSGQSQLWKQVLFTLSTIQTQFPMKRIAPSRSGDASSNIDSHLKDCISNVANTFSLLSGEELSDFNETGGQPSSRKRRRPNDVCAMVEGASPTWARSSPEDTVLPPPDLMSDLIDIYFRNIHPWIPVIHETTFKGKISNAEQSQELVTILHAIASVTARLSDDVRLSKPDVRMQCELKNRERVILSSMESFSMENLQALIIIAFDIIGSGRGPSAWSIVGSMTRTVQQFQLDIEDEQEHNHRRPNVEEFLIKRLVFLGSAESWIEQEERRRIFWLTFLMDRFCSIATGWDVSLASSDITRRLPCHGPLWLEDQGVASPTPFFGANQLGTLAASRSGEKHPSIGGLAYRVEATENLSLVSMFFLKHPVNVGTVQDGQIWMMRFKELDLRLARWKLFLPEKWREASVFNEDGSMDQNLSLAHVIHNTAVILLHQAIAYPSAQWKDSPVRPPSSSSAGTCFAAASEVSIIANKYLQSSSGTVAPEFAFCLFISGRLLLSHALYYSMAVAPQFNHFVKSLQAMSHRWSGRGNPTTGDAENLASKFAARLIQAHQLGAAAATHEPSLDLRQTVYSEKDRSRTTTNSPPNSCNEMSMPVTGASWTISSSAAGLELPTFDDYPFVDQLSHSQSLGGSSFSLAFPPLPLALQSEWNQTTATTGDVMSSLNSTRAFHGHSGHHSPGNLQYHQRDISHNSSQAPENFNLLFDQSFSPLQRISTFLPSSN